MSRDTDDRRHCCCHITAKRYHFSHLFQSSRSNCNRSARTLSFLGPALPCHGNACTCAFLPPGAGRPIGRRGPSSGWEVHNKKILKLCFDLPTTIFSSRFEASKQTNNYTLLRCLDGVYGPVSEGGCSGRRGVLGVTRQRVVPNVCRLKCLWFTRCDTGHRGKMVIFKGSG